MSLARTHRDFARRRRLPAALALALIAAMGAEPAHFALTKHAYCPEHGEFIHPDAAPHEGTTGPRSDAPELYASHGEQHHGHDHCVVTGERRKAVLPSRASAVIQVPDRPADVDERPLWAPLSTSRFRIAPKQSPPA
jgi:hypothetical protein